ncbi:MAG: adenine nucleotide alpha hydrolase family protein [Chloroflexi bacterium]|nr:adenine nucleotide alpha hydrolase family protein [Chloroflexota bacterium]
MKCRKCGEKAVIHMRQHKLALCKNHYLDWIPKQTQRFIHDNKMFGPEDRILVAVSGGKDSLVLWDVLSRLGYQVDGLYIGLGIDGGKGYSAESRRFTESYAAEHKLDLITYDIEEHEGLDIPTAASMTRRGRERPCSICGLSKRHIMNRVAIENDYDVLVTGHNLDDEAAVLFGNTLNWLTAYLQRQGPVLPNRSGLVKKAKPFFRFYERETAAYALLRGIEYMYDECPYAVGAKSIYYKELLNRLEADRRGAKLSFYLSFLRAKETMNFNSGGDDVERMLHPCTACGQPTSTPDLCTYCRTWKEVRDRRETMLEQGIES